jgi:hypothetical protein
MLLLSDPEPEALIEEARRRQRQRSRRRTVVLTVASVLVLLGFGINQLARGGSSVQATPAPSAPVAPTAPTVTYEKIVVQKIVPLLPVEQKTIETWSSTIDPLTVRQVVTIAGGPTVEIGSGPGQDPVLGKLEMNYLYDRSTNTIYRAGYYLESGSEKTPSPKSIFKQVLDRPGVHLAGSRMYVGRPVYVVKGRDKFFSATTFVDKRTYEPLFSVSIGTDLRFVVRTLAYRTLPATRANLALTSLGGVHPAARTVLHASPQIRELYGEAAFPSGQHA